MSRCTDTCCRPDYDDIETIFIGSSRQRANKNHRCDDCGDTIVLGTVYVREAWKIDGEIYARRFHYHGCDYGPFDGDEPVR